MNNAGVVEEGGDGAKLPIHCFEQPHDVVLTAHVCLNGDGTPAGFLDFVDDSLGVRRVTVVVDRDLVSTRAAELCCGSTDAAAAARDNENTRHAIIPVYAGPTIRAGEDSPSGLQGKGARERQSPSAPAICLTNMLSPRLRATQQAEVRVW